LTPIWKIFKDIANRREQSPEHMVIRAVVGCLGTIVEEMKRLGMSADVEHRLAALIGIFERMYRRAAA
jgi:hypothetical protein